MNTPKHATDPEINALFELLTDLSHDVFEQRRKAPEVNKPRTLTTVETEPQLESKVAK